MKICVKISDMSSCHLGVPVSPMRPSEFSDDAKAALQYLAGVLHIAFEEAQIALRRFPPSRAEKWVVRTQLKDMCHPAPQPRHRTTACRPRDQGRLQHPRRPLLVPRRGLRVQHPTGHSTKE